MRITIALLLIVIPSAAYPKDDVVIKSGFVTGNQYRALPEDERRKYAMGVVDGAFLAPFFGAPKPELLWMETCLTRMQDGQIVAILDKYLSENPVRWHEPMNVLAYVAFKSACTR